MDTNMRQRRFFLALIGLLPPALYAESDSQNSLDPVVVTATRSTVKESALGNTMTVITAEEIKARRLNSVSDVLRVVPGLDVVSAGGTGQQVSVFTRGANSNQTLVLIDNIQMNDPSNPNNSFDFANLQVDNIERIEILRGAASAMWGADAMGGVIHIITKHGKGAPTFSGLAEGGNYNTWKTGGGISGSEDRLNYTLNASHLSNLGVSAAAQSMGNRERDPYQNTTVQGRLGYEVTDDLDLDWTLRYNAAETGLDNCGGSGYVNFNKQFVPCDNPFYFSDTNQLYTRGQARLFTFDNLWEQRFGVNYTLNDRQTRYTTTPSPNWVPATLNQGQQTKVEWLHILHLHETDTVTGGIEGKFDTLDNQNAYSQVVSSMNNAGYYLQNQLDWLERFHTTLGGRLDDNSLYGSHLTWRYNQSVEVPELQQRLKANVGTAFRPPSLCELNKACYGNPDLKPETSLNWDAGLEQDLLDKKVTGGVLYFDNRFSNLIQWDPSANGGLGNVENVSSAVARGIESFLEWKPWDVLAVRANYTFDQTHGLYNATSGQQTNDALLLRPKNKGNFDIDYHILPDVTTHLNVLVVGNRSSFDVNGAVVNVPGYVLVNVSGNYEVTQNITLFARLDNLLNKQYQQVWGYGALGFTGIGGVNVTYD